MEELSMNMYSNGQMDELIRILNDPDFIDILMQCEYGCYRYKFCGRVTYIVLN